MSTIKIEVYVIKGWVEISERTLLGITSCRTLKEAVNKVLDWEWGIRVRQIEVNKKEK